MLLKADNIYKSYDTVQVLRDVSITIDKGSFVSIMGASGAGKSTLLHILGTLDQPDQGELFFEDQQPFKMYKKQQSLFRNREMGFVFQFHHLLPEFTAIENVCMPLWIAGKNKKEAFNRANELLERVGLAHRAEHKPMQMSGGEQQRVAIARALAMQPKIIFADEPTGNLDSENADSIHKLFLELKKELGITLVVVTHNQQLAELADRILLMQDGIIISDTLKPDLNPTNA